MKKTIKIKAIKGFGPTIRMFNRYYIKSFYGPFFSILFPSIVLVIQYLIFDSNSLFSGTIAMGAVIVGLVGIPNAVLDFRKSILLKRIGSSPVNENTITFVIAIYFFIVLLFSCSMQILISLIYEHSDINSAFSNLANHNGVAAIGFACGIFINNIFGISIGLLIASFAKSNIQANAIGWLIIIPTIFFSGQLIPMNVISSNEVLNWISSFMPFRYSTMIINSSWMGANPFIEFTSGISSYNSVTSLTLVDIDYLINISTNGDLIDPRYTLWEPVEIYRTFDPYVCYGLIFPLIIINLSISSKYFRWQ